MMKQLLIAPALACAAFSAGEIGKTPAKLTFTEHIAPIVFNNCTSCHRPGEAAPFALMSYQDVKKRGALIAAVTQSRYMPPWRAAPGYGDFIDVHRLTDGQIAGIKQWVDAGMPEGDPAKLPALPKFPEGWQLGKPDMVLAMTEPFDLPASGPDIYRNFTIPLNLPENKWVKAIEFRPSARKVVHHALFFVDTTSESRKHDGEGGKPGYNGGLDGTRFAKSGRLGGWAVGANPHFLPSGLALPLPKGSDFVLQVHFHLSGKAETEQSTIGIYLADEAPERMLAGVQLPAVFGVGAGIDIPAGEKAFTIRDSFTLPIDVEGLAIGGHAHYICKDMQAVAILPDGTRRWLLWIKDWDFSWQDQYQYKSPVPLPKGTRIDVAITYDNSADNPHNPSHPPKRVKWGEQSFDEMGSVTLQVVPAQQTDYGILLAALQQRRIEAIKNAYKNRMAGLFDRRGEWIMQGPLQNLEQWDDFVKDRYDPNRKQEEFRQHTMEAPPVVQEFYRLNHASQTRDFVLQKRREYLGLNKRRMGVWEAMDYLNNLVDDSDPDTNLSQIEHLLQTSEAIRRDGHPRWFILTGLIHDLGKVLCLWGEAQWAVVGDTFPVGCAWSDTIVYHDFFAANPDSKNPQYQTPLGVYSEGCGLDKVDMSWGHDEYMYHVVKDYLPDEALYMIRYHSFYPWHQEGAYYQFMDERDKRMLPWVQAFNPYDLYSKSAERPDLEKVKPFYRELIAEYFPVELQW